MRTKSPGSSKALPVNEYYLLCFWIGAAVQCSAVRPKGTGLHICIGCDLNRIEMPKSACARRSYTTQANKISCQAHNRSHQSWRCLPFMRLGHQRRMPGPLGVFSSLQPNPVTSHTKTNHSATKAKQGKKTKGNSIAVAVFAKGDRVPTTSQRRRRKCDTDKSMQNGPNCQSESLHSSSEGTTKE